MSKKAAAYIYSTLSASQRYGTKAGSVLIQGGTGVTNKHFLTPRGVVTGVTQEQLEALKEHATFKSHCDKGFITISVSEQKVEKMTKDMEKKDAGAQETTESWKAKGDAVAPIKDK